MSIRYLAEALVGFVGGGVGSRPALLTEGVTTVGLRELLKNNGASMVANEVTDDNATEVAVRIADRTVRELLPALLRYGRTTGTLGSSRSRLLSLEPISGLDGANEVALLLRKADQGYDQRSPRDREAQDMYAFARTIGDLLAAVKIYYRRTGDGSVTAPQSVAKTIVMRLQDVYAALPQIATEGRGKRAVRDTLIGAVRNEAVAQGDEEDAAGADTADVASALGAMDAQNSVPSPNSMLPVIRF